MNSLYQTLITFSRSVTIALIFIPILLFIGKDSGVVNAGLISGDHGRAHLWGSRSGTLYDEEFYGNSFSHVREASAGGNGIQGARTKALIGGTSAISDGPLRLSALAWSNGGNPFRPAGLAYAEGNWKDVIYLYETTFGAPSELIVKFEVTGQFTKQGGGGGASTFGKLKFDVFGDTEVFAANSESRIHSEFRNPEFFGTASNFEARTASGALWYGGDRINSQAGWDSYSFDSSPDLAAPNLINFRATKTVPISYDANFGGYDFQMWAVALASEGGTGFLDADFSNSFAISTVQLPNGTLLSDADLRFDSGLTLAAIGAVPEPTSIAIFCAGILGASITRGRRKTCV